MGALRNRCRLYWRARSRKLYTAVDKVLLESVATSESSPQDSADFLHDLNSLLAELPSRCRSLFQLRYRQGYEAPEVAQKLGYKASSIYKISERCMSALTQRMVDCGLVDGGCDD
jgi:RNA polymerase sigma factor (sigma-70 family)